MWRTLDFQNTNDKIENGGAAVHSRFRFLKNSLSQLYADKRVNREQVGRILDYMQRTLFSHLQLYLNCLGQKQEKRDKPVKIMIQVPQRAPAGGLEGQGCIELQDDFDGANDSHILNAEGPPADVDLNASQAENEEASAAQGDSPTKDEELPEEFEEDDPLFGLERRLRHAKIDDESKTVIKQKLIDAQNKVKEQLKER